MSDKRAAGLGAAMFGWTQNPRAPAAFAIGLALITAGLVALEALLPRGSQGQAFDGRIGFYALAGLTAGVGLTLIALLIGRISAAIGNGDDDDQP